MPRLSRLEKYFAAKIFLKLSSEKGMFESRAASPDKTKKRAVCTQTYNTQNALGL